MIKESIKKFISIQSKVILHMYSRNMINNEFLSILNDIGITLFDICVKYIYVDGTYKLNH